MTIDDIKNGITAWATVINEGDSETILDYLNQGFCFQVDRENYDKWRQQTPTPVYVHAYAGIFSGKLKFVLIDSTSDFVPQENMDNIVVKDFTHGIPSTLLIGDNDTDPAISLDEGMRRNFKWNMYCRVWLASILNNPARPMFQVIRIPIVDYEDIFKVATNMKCINFFGLEDGSGVYNIEFIIADEPGNYKLPTTLYDISRPVPPFGGGLAQDDYQLLPA